MTAKTIVLHLAKGLGLFALARTFTRSAPRILCYHGGSLGDEHLFNPKLFCRPGVLARRLEWLKHKGFVPSSLDAVFQPNAAAQREGIPLIVTLDDGWYSSATDLLPLLAQFGHQPVLYLATKVFANGGPVTDVCIRYIVWKSPLISAKLRGLHANLDGVYELHQAADQERLYTAAEQWLNLFDENVADRVAALEQLGSALGVPANTLNLASRRFNYMSRAELLASAQRGCHVELHGHVHQYLRGQSEWNRADIESCRQHIVEVGLPSPRHYCYPSGDYDEQAPTTLADAGVATATTCVPGLVRGTDGDHRYFLPRFLDGSDVAMIEFEAEMSGVLEFLRRTFRRAV